MLRQKATLREQIYARSMWGHSRELIRPPLRIEIARGRGRRERKIEDGDEDFEVKGRRLVIVGESD